VFDARGHRQRLDAVGLPCVSIESPLLTRSGPQHVMGNFRQRFCIGVRDD
jgi:hypothetical protein